MVVLLIWAPICISFCVLKWRNAWRDPERDCWTLSRGLSESKAKDEDKTKTDAVKEESNNSGDNAAIIVTEEASEKNKTEPEVGF